ncbi:bleomycin resistance protein [Paenibacillus gorillae]|uniref:bleomycin resistance protein n=1 Tax=Paenibacillus gorillae TaxID=1243662 RepID=UPI0004AE8023|nr:VOC family protein [Paenibacillus gorillae]
MLTKPAGTTIPILPCKSIDEQLAFYQALGFELTYRQAKPNLYACVRHRIAELHFFVLKQLDPANTYSMCYVSVPDVDTVYNEFCENLKKAYQKIPSKGFPRLTKLNNLSEDRRFNLIDPAGNRLLIGQKHASVKPDHPASDVKMPSSRFTKAFDAAYRLAYAKNEPVEAARVLDLGLKNTEDAAVEARFKAYVLRADIAFTMDDMELAKKFFNNAVQLKLTDQTLVGDAIERLDELKVSLDS